MFYYTTEDKSGDLSLYFHTLFAVFRVALFYYFLFFYLKLLTRMFQEP